MPFQNSSKWWWDSRENTRSLSIAWRGTRRWICSICEGSRRRSCASMSRRSGSWRLSWRSWRPSRRFRFGCLALGICFCFLGFICIFFFLFGIGDVYVWNIFLFYIICYDFFPPSTWCILCLCLEKFFIYESCFIIFITVWIFCACQSYIIFSLSLLVLSLF